MQAPIPHLASRLFSLTVFVVVGGLLVGSGISRGLAGRGVLGASVVFMGVFAFLQPLLLDLPLHSLMHTSSALALGSRGLRVGVSVIALLLLVVALVLSVLDL